MSTEGNLDPPAFSLLLTCHSSLSLREMRGYLPPAPCPLGLLFASSLLRTCLQETTGQETGEASSGLELTSHARDTCHTQDVAGDLPPASSLSRYKERAGQAETHRGPPFVILRSQHLCVGKHSETQVPVIPSETWYHRGGRTKHLQAATLTGKHQLVALSRSTRAKLSANLLVPTPIDYLAACLSWHVLPCSEQRSLIRHASQPQVVVLLLPWRMPSWAPQSRVS